MLAKEPTPEPSEKESGELEEGEVGADAGEVTSPPAAAPPAAPAAALAAAGAAKPLPKPMPEAVPPRRQLSSPLAEPRCEGYINTLQRCLLLSVRVCAFMQDMAIHTECSLMSA